MAGWNTNLELLGFFIMIFQTGLFDFGCLILQNTASQKIAFWGNVNRDIRYEQVLSCLAV